MAKDKEFEKEYKKEGLRRAKVRKEKRDLRAKERLEYKKRNNRCPYCNCYCYCTDDYW